MDEHCPRCKSDKHTSLPFGNIVRANGAARTYRCLVCGFFFVRGVLGDDLGDMLMNTASGASPAAQPGPRLP